MSHIISDESWRTRSRPVARRCSRENATALHPRCDLAEMVNELDAPRSRRRRRRVSPLDWPMARRSSSSGDQSKHYSPHTHAHIRCIPRSNGGRVSTHSNVRNLPLLSYLLVAEFAALLPAPNESPSARVLHHLPPQLPTPNPTPSHPTVAALTDSITSYNPNS